MNWDIFMEVWDSFMSFMDRVFQWLEFIFVTGEWPPKEELPDIMDGAEGNK